MKKISIALTATTALSFASIASAQSSVTLSGIVDIGASYFQNESRSALGVTAKTSKTALTQGNLAASRLIIRGVEDMGGGLAASFFFDAGINADDGTTGANVANSGPAVNGLFNRRSTVSLSDYWGEVRLGRDLTPSYWNDLTFDPFQVGGVGTTLIATANGYSSNAAAVNGFKVNTMYSRASNSVGYFLPPNLGGFYGQVMYAFNEQTKYDPGILTPNLPNNSRAGRYAGGRFGYTNGSLDVAAAYAETTLGDSYFAGLTNNLDTYSLGASYDFNVVKVMGEYSKAELKTQNDGIQPTPRSPSATGYLIGATMPIGVGLIRFAYSQVTLDDTAVLGAQPKASKWALGYVHNLSKRTALYTTVAQINNKNGYDLGMPGGPVFVTGGTFQPRTSRGFEVGMRNVF
jgi:predicted porin